MLTLKRLWSRVREPISDTAFSSALIRPQRCGSEEAGIYNEAGLATWLRQRFPVSTGVHVEAATGIPAASVENWLQRRSKPSVENFAALICVFGPALMKACIWRPTPWIESAAQAERLREVKEQIAALEEERQQIEPAE